MRLIDADKLRAHYSWWKDGTGEMTMGEAKDIFDEIVDIQPTAEKHGHWIDVNYDGSLWRCSVCGETQCCKSNYCGDCGAKMNEVKDE